MVQKRTLETPQLIQGVSAGDVAGENPYLEL